MTTAVDVVTRSLNMLGVQSEVNPASPELFELGLDYLQDLIRDLTADDVYLGTDDTPIVIPTDLATDIKERPGTRNGIICMLASRMAPVCRVSVTPEIDREFKLGKRDLYSRFQYPHVCNIVPASTLPLGQGFRHGGYGRTFFGGRTVDNDTQEESS